MDIYQEDVVKILIILSIWAESIWLIYLSIRQLNVLQTSSKIPPELNKELDQTTFDKARNYGWDKVNYELIKNIISCNVNTGFVIFCWLHRFWENGKHFALALGFTNEYTILTSCLFILQRYFVVTLIDTVINAYYTFIIEAKHGFNKQTPSFYVKDRIKKFVITQLFLIPLTAVAVFIVQKGGNMFILWLWISSGIIIILTLMIYPAFIAPLFDKFTPLPEGPLREEIEKLAFSLKFPLGQLYVVEGSMRSSHSNAYLYGLFGSKRIVLYDTLIENFPGTKPKDETHQCNDCCKGKKKGCSNPEIVAVLAHELGHWYHYHTYINLIATQLNLLLLFGAFGYLFNSASLYKALGFPSGDEPIIVGLISILFLVLSPFNALLDFAMTILSRKLEFQADEFAANLGHSENLQKALIKLNIDNLGFPVHDQLYSTWHHSHPTLLQRIKKLEKK